ncbi:MAG TPA: prepilin-type N-terminal cleavage/methylation domain-containing protein [Verrucomicrobiae bacterium]|nr:prepilin-type N-terminal cleavage/methylation domain-containing protein [Verrucomicrobiae bacterium]
MRQRNAGFSLVEVMCAILILGIALAGLTMGITTALSSSKESEVQTSAAMIAAGQIEMIRADSYLTDGEDEGDCGEGLSLYRWKQTISSAGIAGLHEVKVVVMNSNTGQDIYELRTLLFDPASADTTQSGARARRNAAESKKREGRVK